MQTKVINQDNSTYKIEVTISKDNIVSVKEIILKELSKKTKIPGFREGHVPKEIVEKNIDKNVFNREVLNKLLTDAYREIIKERHIKPITNPRFDIKNWQPYVNLEFNITIAEKPEIEIGDYLKFLKTKNSKIHSNDVIESLLNTSQVNLPDILIQDEVDRMLSSLLDQVTSLGLTIEKYLKSKNKTSEQLNSEYREKAKSSLKIELAFQKLLSKENIEVSDLEIEDTIKANPDEESRKQLAKEENKWYIKTIIARQKLIQNIIKQVGDKDEKS